MQKHHVYKIAFCIYNIFEGVDYMFKVRHTEETANRTFRFPKSLLDQMSVIAQEENISLNSFVIQCCEYAIANFEKSKNEKETDG